MKEINSYNSVNKIAVTSKGIVFNTKEKDVLLSSLFLLFNNELTNILHEEVYYFSPFLDGILYENQRGKGIYFFDFNQKREIASASFYLSFWQKLLGKSYITSTIDDERKYYFLKSDFSLEEVPQDITYEIKHAYIRNKVLNRHIIFAYDKETYAPLWETDISGFGRYLDLLCDKEKPNEIEGDLMSYGNLLFVPLAGGQLVALDQKTGEKVWLLEQEIGGEFAVYGDKLYKKNRFLYEIDALTGEILRKKDLKDGSIKENFAAIGPIWRYENYIVLINNQEGDVVVLNRGDFSICGMDNIQASMAYSKDIVLMDKNKLYVLGLNSILHVFELDLPKSIT